MSETRRHLRFKDDREKLAFMREGASRDALKAPIRELAIRLTRRFPPDAWARQIEEIQKFVRDGIRYVHDPRRREELADALTVLSRGVDDCDGKARLTAALGHALGMDATILPVWKGPVLAHVQAGFKWPGSDKYAGEKKDLEGRPSPTGYVVAETTVKGVKLGQSPFSVPKNPETGNAPLA